MNTLELKAREVRVKSTKYSAYGIGITAILSSLVILVGSPQFEALLAQWFAANPVLGGFVLLAVNTVITEILKAISNQRQISEGDIYSASLDDVTFI